jgi:Putative DNA-binding domain
VPSLLELQQRCFDAFALDAPAALADRVVAGRVPAAARIAAYQNNFRELHRRTLAAVYPVVLRLVGAACFAGLAREYALRYPPSSGDLQRFGDDFAVLLDAHYGGTEHAYLGDVARLERLVDEALLAPPQPVLELAALSAWPADAWPTLVFTPSPAAALLESLYPIVAIWRANQPGRDGMVDLARAGERAVVRRRGGDVLVRTLEADAYALAAALRAGAPLERAADALLDGTQARFARALAAAIEAGCLGGVAGPAT